MLEAQVVMRLVKSESRRVEMKLETLVELSPKQSEEGKSERNEARNVSGISPKRRREMTLADSEPS